jgi:hypothetical protein
MSTAQPPTIVETSTTIETPISPPPPSLVGGKEPKHSSIVNGIVLGAAFVLQLGAGMFVLASGLMMPAWAVVILSLLWIAGFFVIYRLRSRPWLGLVVPFATFGMWMLVGTLGEAFLDWQA